MQNNSKKYAKYFIEKANKVHNNKYDYSNMRYLNSRTKIDIVCPIHGNFKQKPVDHARGKGCPDCAPNKKLNTKIFIERANLVHKRFYDYKFVDYINLKSAVRIICPIHGVFEQIAECHLSGIGCRRCSSRRKYSTKEFILEARKIWKNKKDYSDVVYKGVDTKVTIICRKPGHGKYEQTPYIHLKGHEGCKFCLNPYFENFIKKAKVVNGDLYDYNKTEFVNTKTPVTIICKKHGEFEQTPYKHLLGRGCWKCGGSLRKTNKVFIEQANRVHEYQYGYDKANYKDSHTKIEILCLTCSRYFMQTPDSHLRGAGCPKCKSSLVEKKIRKWLTKNRIENIPQWSPGKGPLKRYRFDFFIPKHNILIEYDGEHHFKPIHFGGISKKEALNNLKKTKYWDLNKNNWAKQNNIELIRIPYNEKDRLHSILASIFLM